MTSKHRDHFDHYGRGDGDTAPTRPDAGSVRPFTLPDHNGPMRCQGKKPDGSRCGGMGKQRGPSVLCFQHKDQRAPFEYRDAEAEQAEAIKAARRRLDPGPLP